MLPTASTSLAALVLAASLALSLTNTHGYISPPAATYRNTSTKKYNTILTTSANAGFQGHKAASRRCAHLLDPAAPGCGNIRTDVPPVDVSTLAVMQLQNNEYGQGFIRSHHGPCEVWIDMTRVFHGEDCARTLKTDASDDPGRLRGVSARPNLHARVPLTRAP